MAATRCHRLPTTWGEREAMSLIDELKQRKLVQWAMVYAAAAFALLQGIDIVDQQFGSPGGLQRGITLALVLGFFVVLLLAWFHGERGMSVTYTTN
jgi:hypothetical protein